MCHDVGVEDGGHDECVMMWGWRMEVMMCLCVCVLSVGELS